MQLSRGAALYLQASIILCFLASSSAPTPLYAVYQAQWGLSPITTTIIFGVYAIAVLLALLVVGSLSDYIGRRPVLLVTTLSQALAMILFATAHGVGALIAARILQGLSTGATASCVGAGMLDLDPAKGTVANAISPMLGTATGSVVSGLMVQYLPAPTRLVYLMFAAIFIVQWVGVSRMPETVARREGALASLRPQLRLPPKTRSAMLITAPGLIASWALAGFYASLGPALLRKMMGSTSLAIGGLALFVLAGSGATTALLSRTRPPRTVMLFGTTTLFAGVLLTLLAMWSASIALFFVGAAIAGTGFGASFQGALRSVLPFASPEDKAGVLSVLYVIAYVSLGLPVIFGGVVVVYGGGVLVAAEEYGAAVMLLAALALLGTLLRHPTTDG